MKFTRLGGAVAALLLYASSGCLAAPVVASGMGVTEHQALADAMRQAVEQQSRVSIDSRTYTANFQTIKDQIYSHADGYIQSYKILQSNFRGGTYHVVIKAEVSDRLDSDLMSQANRKMMVGANLADPRIGVVVLDQYQNENLQAENAIITALQEAGCRRVIDMGQMDRVLKQRIANAAFQNDFSLVQSLNSQFHVDYLVTARLQDTSASKVNIQGFQGFQTGRARLELRMMNVNNAEIVMADTLVGTALHSNHNMAVSEAIRNATEGLSGKLSRAILQKAASPEQHVQLLVTRFALGNSGAATQRLQMLPGMSHVHLRSVNNSTMIFDVDFMGSAHDLTAVLEGNGIHVSEMGSEYIKIG